jgi:hypothetical protein
MEITALNAFLSATYWDRALEVAHAFYAKAASRARTIACARPATGSFDGM